MLISALTLQYGQTWFLSFQRPPLISEKTPLKSEAGLINYLDLLLLSFYVDFITESEDEQYTCLVEKTIFNDYSRQLAFTPHLSLFLLDLLCLTVLIHFRLECPDE